MPIKLINPAAPREALLMGPEETIMVLASDILYGMTRVNDLTPPMLCTALTVAMRYAAERMAGLDDEGERHKLYARVDADVPKEALDRIEFILTALDQKPTEKGVN